MSRFGSCIAGWSGRTRRCGARCWRRLPLKEAGDVANLSAIREWSEPYYAEARRFIDTVDTAALACPVKMPWVEEYEKHLGRTFSTRGQVNARLRELGGEPPLVDFIAWIWFGRPIPQWT